MPHTVLWSIQTRAKNNLSMLFIYFDYQLLALMAIALVKIVQTALAYFCRRFTGHAYASIGALPVMHLFWRVIDLSIVI